MAETSSTNGSPNEKQEGDTTSEEMGKAGNPAEEARPQPKKPSILKRIWDRLGLNPMVIILMMKGALPPTIAIALFQSNGFANTFTTLGYFTAIMSVLSFAIMPRAKFLQTMVLNVIAVCVGSALSLLQVYCTVQARIHTTVRPPPGSGGPSPGTTTVGYNSSASAVSGIWLFFLIYLINTARALRPQLQFPAIMVSIFVDVASSYAPQFPTMQSGEAFVKELLEAFLCGFGIATGVSLLVFPITSRTVWLKQATGFLKITQGALQAQVGYLKSLENIDMFSIARPEEPANGTNKKEEIQGKDHVPQDGPEFQKLSNMVKGLQELHGKLHGDLIFAKREIAYGKLDASDLDEIFKMYRDIMLPLVGMSSIADIFHRVGENRGWIVEAGHEPNDGSSEDEHDKSARIIEWQKIMKSLHEPFADVTTAMTEGLQHASIALEFEKAPKKKATSSVASEAPGENGDIESNAGLIKPGDPNFAGYLSKKIQGFHEKRNQNLGMFCKAKGLDLKDDAMGSLKQQRTQRQLYLVLYMEFLLWSTGQAVLKLVEFADDKVEHGVMKQNRLLLPGLKRLRKWVTNIFKVEDSNTEQAPDNTEIGLYNVYVGASYQTAKDPEHLPPTTMWQRFGNGLRGFSQVLGSQESAFGFRVACATLSVGIINYLRVSQHFFLEQRLMWAMIMISIGMTVTAGSGVFGFVGRVAGTVVAMVMSYVIWYIVDGKTSGVIVMLWLFTFLEFYFLIKYPKFVVIALLSIVTQVLILGYELQVRKLGVKVSTSNGQPAYAIYLLAPYRLACVSGGMFVAFIWTFFPYPLTARSQLRKDLGAALFLLANFYSCVHTTVGIRLKGAEGDPKDKSSPGYRLEKARSKVYVKELLLLDALRQHSAFTAWEPSFGGKFPREKYNAIIQQAQK